MNNIYRTKYFHLGIIFFFILFKFIELSLVNICNGDGPWSLSPTLSMLKGDWGWSKFAHELDGQVYKNYSYSILFYLPFKFFGISYLNYIITYFSFIILAVFGIYQIFKNYPLLQFLISVFIVGSVYTYNFRFELLAIVFIIWGFYFLFKKKNFIFIGIFLMSWAALIHPATFVALFFLIIHYLFLEKKLLNLKYILLLLTSFIFFCYLLLGFDINNLLDPIFVRPELKQRFLVIKPENVIKWFVLAGVFIWGFILTFKRIKWFSFLLIGLNILIYLLFKKSYYYPYLILHVILIFYYNKDFIILNNLYKKLFYLHLIVFFLIFFVFPVFKSFENPKYGEMMRSNINYLKNTQNSIDPAAKIYVEKELLFGVTQIVNARLYLSEYQYYFNGSPKIDLKKNDKIYLFKQKEINDFKLKMNEIIYQKDIVIKEIHKPVKGLLTFDGRGEQIGLWEISRK